MKYNTKSVHKTIQLVFAVAFCATICSIDEVGSRGYEQALLFRPSPPKASRDGCTAAHTKVLKTAKRPLHEFYDDLLNDPNDGTLDPSTPGYDDPPERDLISATLRSHGLALRLHQAREAVESVEECF